MDRYVDGSLTLIWHIVDMTQHHITVKFDETLLCAAHEVASVRDISLGQLVRDALNTEIARAKRKASSPLRADERMIARLRAQLAQDLAYAESWPDLETRLQRHDMVLREAGGGLALFSIPTGARLCKASDLGYSLQTLTRRFGKPFPTLMFAKSAYQVTVNS